MLLILNAPKYLVQPHTYHAPLDDEDMNVEYLHIFMPDHEFICEYAEEFGYLGSITYELILVYFEEICERETGESEWNFIDREEPAIKERLYVPGRRIYATHT